MNTGDDYVDNNISNVDGEADKGTIINFNNFKNFDSVYGKLVEEDKTVGISIDQVTTDGIEIAPYSFTHYTPSAINKLLVVNIHLDNGESVDSVSYGGESLTEVISVVHSSGKPRVSVWMLIDPPEGSLTISINLSAEDDIAVGAISYSGVDQITPIDGATSNQGISQSVSLTVTSELGDLVQDAMASISLGIPAIGIGQTEQYHKKMGNTDHYGCASTKPGATSVSMTWTLSESIEWVTVGFNINVAKINEMDQEIQWTSVNTSMANYTLAIYCGTFNTTENIQVYIWRSPGPEWELISSDLTANSWNNITITNFKNNTITIRFLGGSELFDPEKSAWNIDAAIIYGWTPDIPTTLNADKTSLTKEVGKKAVFNLTFTDSQGFGITGANLTYVWDYGSGQLVEKSGGVYTLTLNTSSLDERTYYINVTASLENYETKFLQVSLVIVTPKIGFMDQLLDYLPYIVLLILGAFGSVVLKRVYSARRQEWLDKEKIRRIMVVWKSFALYDQTPSEVVAEGDVLDEQLVSGFFTAIKDITTEVAGTTLETMKVYPSFPYYFVYTGNFNCVLILSDKPSPRLENKLLSFAEVTEEKYGKVYSSGLLGELEINLDLDGEVMRIFGITPVAALQDIITVSLSYEEIDKAKVSDDVEEVLKAGRVLTDQLGKFPLEELIQAAGEALGDMSVAHNAVLEALQLGLVTVLEKVHIKKEESLVPKIKSKPESVKKVKEEEKKEEKPTKF